jgi:hypothetical protein
MGVISRGRKKSSSIRSRLGIVDGNLFVIGALHLSDLSLFGSTVTWKIWVVVWMDCRKYFDSRLVGIYEYDRGRIGDQEVRGAQTC